MKSLQELQSTLEVDNYDMDTEIQDIFIEESVEVLQDMDINLPQWTDTPANFKTLSEIRRGFHTIKGSGRMVGANNIGAVAWAVESLLNRVLNNSIVASKEVVEFINEAKAVMPYLINDFANQQAPSIDPAILMLMAKNLELGRIATAGLYEDESIEEDAEIETLSESPSVSAPVIEESIIEESIIKEATIETIEEVETKKEEPIETIVEDIPIENLTKKVERENSEEIENKHITNAGGYTTDVTTDDSSQELPNTLLIDDYFDNYDSVTSSTKISTTESPINSATDNEKEALLAQSHISPKHVHSERLSPVEHSANSKPFSYNNITPIKKSIFIGIAIVVFILLAVLIF